MARTVAEVLTSARLTLNDVAGDRYGDLECIGFVVDALNTVKNIRPDLFIGSFDVSIGTLTTASALPVDEQFFRPVVDYVIARCKSKDDEDMNVGLAALMAKFGGSFLT